MHRQLELFHYPKTEEEELREELSSISNSLDNLRRGLFKRHSILAESVSKFQYKVNDIEKQLQVIECYLKKSFDLDCQHTKKQGELF